MLYTFLLTLLVIDCFVLMAAVLLQSGKGTGLAANFGGASSSPDAFIGIRQAGNLLTKASWWSGGIFLFLCFVLQIMSTHTSAPRSVLEKGLATPQQQAAPPTSAPAVPLEPAPSTKTPATTPNNAPATTPTPKK
ncbi:MAG TPA: preprotein translocase subunit SecG [Gemmatimonadaceae bacterium]|jgi:preprotein translocase subunit SecG|nr:preprotein translocase subunit SecG [Gemmatimonadaceae bacterium]